jgi:hypothetical protein
VILRSALRSPAGLRCWVGAVGGQGAGQGLVQRGGVDRQLGGDLGAVDDEGFLELVLQLEQFPDRGVGDAQGSKQEYWGAAELGLGLAGQPVDGGRGADPPNPALKVPAVRVLAVVWVCHGPRAGRLLLAFCGLGHVRPLGPLG